MLTLVQVEKKLAQIEMLLRGAAAHIEDAQSLNRTIHCLRVDAERESGPYLQHARQRFDAMLIQLGLRAESASRSH